MTITKSEIEARRTVRRRITKSNGAAREYSQEERRPTSAANGSHAYGLWAGLPGSVDEFLRERRECDGL